MFKPRRALITIAGLALAVPHLACNPAAAERTGSHAAALSGFAGPLPVRAPEALLIYRSYPSQINGANGNLPRAAAHFATYRYVVLAGALSNHDEATGQPIHRDFEFTKALAHRPELADTMMFASINLGPNIRNHSMDEIRLRLGLLKEMGMTGVFLDDFGYAQGSTRHRQNEAVQSAHALGLRVIANTFWVEEALGSEVDPVHNPEGVRPALGPSDFYLAESFQVRHGKARKGYRFARKAAKMLRYQRELGIGLMATTTQRHDEQFEPALMEYAYMSASLLGMDAFSWGETEFCADTRQAPFRARPGWSLGGTFFGPPTLEGRNLADYGSSEAKYAARRTPTIVRDTDVGQAVIDLANARVWLRSY